MAITDQQFQDWLESDGKFRIVLVEAEAYSGGTVVTRYMSNGAYVTKPTDTPANIAYEDIVLTVPFFRSAMNEQFRGGTTPSWGSLETVNTGEYDSWLDDAWDGRPIRFYLGDPTWDRADFRLILSLVTEDISTSPGKNVFKLRDKQQLVNEQIQSNLMTGSTANVNQPIPLCFGECYNITPLLIDAATYKYKIHDGQIEAITTVYSNGVSVAFTASLADGTFTLNAAPTGTITCDAKGSKTGGTYANKVADIVKRILVDHNGVSAGDIDTAAFTAFNTACPQVVGIYIKERLNTIPVLDSLLKTVGGFWTTTRAGKFTVGRLLAPPGSPVLSISADDIVENTLELTKRILPVKTVRLGYKKNWTVQSSGLNSSVTASRAAELGQEYQVVSVANAGVSSTYLRATEPDMEGTLFVSQSDASTECSRRSTLNNILRKVYKMECFTTPQKLEIGMEVRLIFPRYDLQSGKNCIVIGITERPVDNRVTLELWS